MTATRKNNAPELLERPGASTAPHSGFSIALATKGPGASRLQATSLDVKRGNWRQVGDGKDASVVDASSMTAMIDVFHDDPSPAALNRVAAVISATCPCGSNVRVFQ
jgi:hypothetical protein